MWVRFLQKTMIGGVVAFLLLFLLPMSAVRFFGEVPLGILLIASITTFVLSLFSLMFQRCRHCRKRLIPWRGEVPKLPIDVYLVRKCRHCGADV